VSSGARDYRMLAEEVLARAPAAAGNGTLVPHAPPAAEAPAPPAKRPAAKRAAAARVRPEPEAS
jgi:hypothetical protein